MNKKQGIATIATLGVLAVATASPASAHHGQRQESKDRTTRISAAATTTPAVVDSAHQAFDTAKAAAKVTRDAALAVATTDEQRTAANTAYKTQVRAAHDIKKSAGLAARTAFDAALTTAKGIYTAETGLTPPKAKSRR